jgi:hypothetical protein
MTVICHAFYYHLALRGRIQLEKSSRQDERANLTCEKSFPPRRAVEFKERFPPRRAGEFNLREVPAKRQEECARSASSPTPVEE